jgi:hypothetical protein
MEGFSNGRSAVEIERDFSHTRIGICLDGYKGIQAFRLDGRIEKTK